MGTVILGILLGLGILLYSLISGATKSGIILDAYSMVLVLGGSLSATLMSVTYKNLKELFGTIKTTVTKSNLNKEDVTDELISISEAAANTKTLTSLVHHSENILIQKGIRLLQNEIDPTDIKRIMSDFISNEKNQILQNSEILRSIAKYPPSFGMIGTILGLVGLLEEMSLSSGIETIGIKMAMALVTTLYGILIANYILLPLAEIIVNKAQYDLKMKKQILDTFVLISSNKNDPVLVKEYLGVLGVGFQYENLKEVS